MFFPRFTLLRSAMLLVIASMLVALPLLAEDAPALYKSKCAMCHGPDGRGDTTMGKKLAIRSLASADVQKQSDADLLRVITDGKGKMPAYGTKLDAAKIQALVAHLRTFAAK